MEQPVRKRGPSHTDLRNDINVLLMAQQQMSTDITSIKKTVGDSGRDEHGKIIGTGIAGDLARLSEKVSRYDGWVKFGTGFMAAMFLVGPIIWWLVERRLEIFR